MKPATARVPWRDGVLQEFDRLNRWFAGRFATELSPSDESIPARALLDPDTLRGLIRGCGSSTSVPTGPNGNPSELDDGIEDVSLGVATSRFTRHYAAAVTTAALAGLSQGVGLDLSIDHCTMILRNSMAWRLVPNLPQDKILRIADSETAWDVFSGPVVDTREELRAFTWRKLYAENLWPVLELAAEIGKISPNVVWTNAAEWPPLIRSSAIEYLGPEGAAPYEREVQALLDAPTLPGVPSDTNIIADKLEFLPGDGKGFPEVVQKRKYCCLTYLLADRFGRLCEDCPYLPLSDGIALIRERHGVPMGTPSGAAEQRSIQQGLARPSARRAQGAKKQD